MNDRTGLSRAWLLLALAAGVAACARASIPSGPAPAARTTDRESGASGPAPAPDRAPGPDRAPAPESPPATGSTSATDRAPSTTPGRGPAPPARVRAPDMAPARVAVPEPAPAPGPPLPPVPPPSIRFTDLAGLRAEIAGFGESGRPVLVNFWATWCGPCVHELPLLGDLAREWGDDGPAIVGVSLDHLTAPDDDRAMGRVQRMLITHRASYPNRIVRGEQQEILDAFGIVGGIPFSILYDGRGAVSRRFSGAVDREAVGKAVRGIDQAVGS